MRRKVVITGLGIISPNGAGKEEFWKNCIQGKSAVRPVDFPGHEFKAKFYSPVMDFRAEDFGLSRLEVESTDRYIQFAVCAAKMAVDDARINWEKINRRKVSVVLANAICGTKFMEEEFLAVTEHGQAAINPKLARSQLYDASMFNTPSIRIASLFGLQGETTTVSTGCTAGCDSLGIGWYLIRSGRADMVFSGAAEAPLTPVAYGAFDIIGALTKEQEDPHKASRPFDLKRSGFVLAEGSAILILEDLEHALKRNAHIYCEVIGYDSTSNAYHMTDLQPEGLDLARSIEGALRLAGISPRLVDYVCAHGSSTPQNDVNETNALKKVLGDHVYKTPISSLKSMIGHPLSAANSLELALACLIMENKYITPTINYEIPDPQCDLDYVVNQGRDAEPNIVLKIASGFSGIHSAVLLRRNFISD